MTNLNHNRPILRLIDDKKKALREFNKRSEALEAKDVKLSPSALAKIERGVQAKPIPREPDVLAPIHLKTLSALVDAIEEYYTASKAYAVRFDKEKRRCKPARAQMNFMAAQTVIKARIRAYVAMALRNIADNDRQFSPLFYQTHMTLVESIKPMRAVRILFEQETKVLEPYVKEASKIYKPAAPKP